jgi:hypothetical protein
MIECKKNKKYQQEISYYKCSAKKENICYNVSCYTNLGKNRRREGSFRVFRKGYPEDVSDEIDEEGRKVRSEIVPVAWNNIRSGGDLFRIVS